MISEISEVSSEDSSSMFVDVPWTWWDLLMVICITTVGLVISIVVAGVGYVLLDYPSLDEAIPISLFFFIGTAIYLALIFGIYWRTVRFHQTPWSSLGINQFNPLWLLAIPPLFILQISAAAAVNQLLIAPLMGGEFENPQIEAISGGNPLSFVDFVLLFILIAIVAPIAEELFFRGMLYPLLRKRFSVWPAIIFNAILFALIHFLPVLIPALFIIGLFLTWIRARSQSIYPSIFLHMLQNGLAIVSIYLFLSTDL